MNLGIAGRKAIVCASSRGLGKACARALAEAGCEVVINGRDGKKLEAAATELSSFAGVKVVPVLADVATPEGQKGILAGGPHAGYPQKKKGGPAKGGFPQTYPPANDRRRDREYGGCDRIDSQGDRSHVRTQIRSHRQYHLCFGKNAVGWS